MEKQPISTVKTQGEAADIAIEWQDWASEQNLSYGELADWADYFEALGKKFGLTDEFEENGII